MATFSLDSDLQSQLDWRILQNGAISLYFQPGVLAEATAWLRQHGYIVQEFDCAGWLIKDDMHDELAG